MAKTKVKAIHYPKREAEVVGFYNDVVTKLAGLVVKYGISPATMTLLQANNTAVQESYAKAVADAGVAEQSNQTKYDVFAKAKIDILNVFTQIQKAPNFEEGDAELLGFRVVSPPVDLRNVKPVITGVTTSDTQVILDWVRAHMEGVIIYGSYDGKNFTEIGRDTRSPYEDERKNQTSQPEERYYKFKYMKSDKAVGLFTDIVKVIAEIY